MKTNSYGFTLVEAIVCLALLAILLGAGIPAITQFLQNQRISSATMRLHGSLLLARSEAIKRGQNVQVEAAGASWTNGWRTYVDTNNNGALDGGDTLIREESDYPATLRMEGNMPVSRYVRYTPSGRTRTLGGGFQAGTITLCDRDGRLAIRQIVISAAGRPRVVKRAPGEC